jgi:hypothetical protein
MPERKPGLLCASQVGRDWIDDGTLCRSRSAPPGPVGGAGATHRALGRAGRGAGTTHRALGRVGRGADKGVAVAVKYFTATGPHTQLGKGLADMLITDLVNTKGACNVTVVEWEKRALVEAEIELQYTADFDPGSRVKRGSLINPDAFVTGSVATSEKINSWTLELVEAKTGSVIGGDKGSAKDVEILKVTTDIAQRLIDQLCRWWMKKSSGGQRASNAPSGNTVLG